MATRTITVRFHVPRWRTRAAIALVRVAIVVHEVAPALAFAIVEVARELARRGVRVTDGGA